MKEQEQYSIRIYTAGQGAVYISGKTICEKGERHARLVKNIYQAKKYKTESGAYRSLNRLKRKCSNLNGIAVEVVKAAER